MEMSEDDLKLFKEKLEEEFDSLIKKGEDVRSFLYLPYNFLTPKIKEYLDTFLIKEAYKELESGNLSQECFLVYQDTMLTVKLETTQKQLDLLNRMLDFFTSKEEYEKCAKVHELITTIKHV
jgi:hypothetical protein